MRIIFAKIIDDTRSAIVIDMGNNSLIGGVGVVSRVTNEGASLSDAMKRQNFRTTDMTIHWQWCKSIKNANTWIEERLWEIDPDEAKRLMNMKTIEGKANK